MVKYYRNPKNEFGFLVHTLQKKFTNLPANILIDDAGLWSNMGNKKIVLLQTNNSIDTDFNAIIPMTLEPEPQLLVKNEKIELTAAEMEQIKKFVTLCRPEIIKLGSSNSNFSTGEFMDTLIEIRKKYVAISQ